MFVKVCSALLAATFSLSVMNAQTANAPASAGLKIGIVNAQRAVAESEEIKKAQIVLEGKYRPRTQQLETLQRELQAIQQQLQARTAPPEKEQQLQVEGQRKQKELQRDSEDLQADVDRERQEILGKSGRQMQEVIRKLAEEKGLDVLIDAGSTFFFKPTFDITNDAIAAYNKAYPAK